MPEVEVLLWLRLPHGPDRITQEDAHNGSNNTKPLHRGLVCGLGFGGHICPSLPNANSKSLSTVARPVDAFAFATFCFGSAIERLEQRTLIATAEKSSFDFKVSRPGHGFRNVSNDQHMFGVPVIISRLGGKILMLEV